MSAANGTQRDIGLDLTRILAFLAVPSVHFFLNSTYYDTAIVGPRMALMTVMRTAFMVCVPLYMLLSGYLSAGKHIPLTRSSLLGYYKKLLPIFLTYALSTGVILLYRVLWLGEEQTIRSAVKNLLGFQQYSWYMNMYFGLLLLTPFLNALWQSLATPAARRARKEAHPAMENLCPVWSISTICIVPRPCCIRGSAPPMTSWCRTGGSGSIPSPITF